MTLVSGLPLDMTWSGPQTRGTCSWYKREMISERVLTMTSSAGAPSSFTGNPSLDLNLEEHNAMGKRGIGFWWKTLRKIICIYAFELCQSPNLAWGDAYKWWSWGDSEWPQGGSHKSQRDSESRGDLSLQKRGRLSWQITESLPGHITDTISAS